MDHEKWLDIVFLANEAATWCQNYVICCRCFMQMKVEVHWNWGLLLIF